MNDTFWQSPMGIAFLKAQAGHEAGKTYTATADADWIEAQKRVFSGVAPSLPSEQEVDGVWLQISLNRLGASPSLVVDGIVGAATMSAVPPLLRRVSRTIGRKTRPNSL
jgi:hypothetical protein